MHSPESCSSFCDCHCDECLVAGDHRRHAGPLALVAERLQAERDPITPDLDRELAGVRGSIRYPGDELDGTTETERRMMWGDR